MGTKRTILFIETGVNGGGSFESLYGIIANLDRRSFRPIVLYLNRTAYVDKMRQLKVDVFLARDLLYSNIIPKNMNRLLVGLGWTIGKYCPRYLPGYEAIVHINVVLMIRRIVIKRGVDLVLLNNNILRNFFCVVALNGLSVPIVCYLRSFITRGMTSFMASYGNKRINRYVAYSQGVKEWWTKTGVDDSKVDVIHHGIETAYIRPLDVWKRIGVNQRKGPLVGCVGAVRVNRGYDFMIRAFCRVVRREPDAFLVIIGIRNYKNLGKSLETLTKELGIENSVRFHGPDPEARRMIAGLDIFAIPYRVEPFGRILLEAWLGYTPVIATRKGRIDQIITHGKNGILVDYADEGAMSQAILKLWGDEDFRQSLASQGRLTVEKKFAIRNCIEKLEGLFDRIILHSTKTGPTNR